jgi:subtilisin family serine protease
MLFHLPARRQLFHEDLLLVRVRPSSAPFASLSLPALPTLTSPGFSALAFLERAGQIRRVVPLDEPERGGPLPAADQPHVARLALGVRPEGAAGPLVGARLIETQPGTDLRQLQLTLAQDPHFESISRVPVRYLVARARPAAPRPPVAAAVPPAADTMWNLRKIRWAEARGQGLDRADTLHVAVLDTGIDRGHPDLPGDQITYTYSYTGVPTSPSESDFVGHGTHVSGTIRALINNGLGINGICDCRLSVYKIFGDSTEYFDELGYFSYYVDPVLYRKALASCLASDVQVINLSIGGGGEPDPTEAALFQGLVQAGKAVVAAMGNESSSEPSFPAAIPGVIAVGASALDDSVADFSNSGSHIALCAPGVGIWSTLPTYPGQLGYRPIFGRGGSLVPGSPIRRETDYDAWPGTSMATPHVTAAAALAIQKYGTMAVADLRALLMNAVDKPAGMNGQDFTPSFGSGRLNLVKLALGT